MSTSRIPPILEQYTRAPQAGELVLLTNVLGAGTNWLISQFLCSTLAEDPRRRIAGDDAFGSGHEIGGTEEEKEETAVLLVSWMRDLAFWTAEGRKAWGLDLARLAQRNRFTFIDGLTELFITPAIPGQHPNPNPHHHPPASPLPIRSTRTITPRGPPPSASSLSPLARNPPAPPTPSTTTKLTSPSLQHIESTILSAISTLSTPASPKRIILILDHPDLLLATGATSTPPSPSQTTQHSTPDTSTAVEPLRAMLHTLCQHVHAAVVSLVADAPLANGGGGGGGGGSTPLETNHAALLAGLAHVADLVLSVRLLDTGFARDVSGVVRVSGAAGEGAGREVLYYVGKDGVVKAFERGGAGGVGEGS
ncbi:uncharacterized protein BDZ99DRAFT_574825 [Mytilinidion resinicola]|uniref:Elongator complex protein 6 n=1 Tax=Mytilinidion resinicola TaxID=574789 RepID=A0A6A6Y8R2_9PEZI|nr:uncharacterized protein BDZ99DRAFT_574825 [Mytilinidion resinicola]KAF2805226.1 hypothetical protein BDZ99DRAFT_574825 [Mytilinidion resinicola]